MVRRRSVSILTGFDVKESRRNWLIALMVALSSLAMAIGFSTPASRLSAVEKTVMDHEIRLAKMDQKLDDILNGVGALLKRR